MAKNKNTLENQNNSAALSTKIINEPRNLLSPEDYRLIYDYMCQKFMEIKEMFSKFSAEDFYLFIQNSNFLEHSGKDLIFPKIHNATIIYLYCMEILTFSIMALVPKKKYFN